MAKSMIASQMTDGQIDNVVDRFRMALRKQRKEFNSQAVQEVLGIKNVGVRLLESFSMLVSVRSNIFSRMTDVLRHRSLKDMVDATGRQQLIDSRAIVAAPRSSEEGQVEVVFFKLNRYVHDDDLSFEYRMRDLVPADIYSLAAVNEADPFFADTYPNMTHFKYLKDSWCRMTFDRVEGGERFVTIEHNDEGHGDYWWFAGLRKPLPKK